MKTEIEARLLNVDVEVFLEKLKSLILGILIMKLSLFRLRIQLKTVNFIHSTVL